MLRGTPRSQRGTEIVEFAITAFLLFILLFGIIEFSIILFDQATITNASREGARTGILFHPQPRDIAAENTAITTVVDNYAQTFLMSLGGASSMTINVQRSDLNGDGMFDSGDELRVTVTYPYHFLILPSFVSSLSDFALAGSTVMRAE